MQVAEGAYTLAATYKDNDKIIPEKFLEAEKLLLKCLDIFESYLGPAHGKVGENLQKYPENFDLYTILDDIQYTEYYATKKGHYGWHQDIGSGWLSKRKVSITVQLSGPDEYEGGDLEYWRGGDGCETAPKDKGLVFIFPSYMMHRVTPVTKGIRRSFVLWVGGEHYR